MTNFNKLLARLQKADLLAFLLSTTWPRQTFPANSTYVIRLGRGGVRGGEELRARGWRQGLEEVMGGLSPTKEHSMAMGRGETFIRSLMQPYKGSSRHWVPSSSSLLTAKTRNRAQERETQKGETGLTL